jgi:hypothetical protein
MEGIKPEELRFKPKEDMKEPGMKAEVLDVRFSYTEQNRKKLIKTVKKTRDALIRQQKRRDRLSQSPEGGDLHGGLSTLSLEERTRIQAEEIKKQQEIDKKRVAGFIENKIF